MESNRGSAILGKAERVELGVRHPSPATFCPPDAPTPVCKHELMQQRIDNGLTALETVLERLVARIFQEPVNDNQRITPTFEPYPLPDCFNGMGDMVLNRCELLQLQLNRIEDGLFG